MSDLCIEPGTGWHGDNFRVINLATPGGQLLRSFASWDEANDWMLAVTWPMPIPPRAADPYKVQR